MKANTTFIPNEYSLANNYISIIDNSMYINILYYLCGSNDIKVHYDGKQYYEVLDTARIMFAVSVYDANTNEARMLNIYESSVSEAKRYFAKAGMCGCTIFFGEKIMHKTTEPFIIREYTALIYNSGTYRLKHGIRRGTFNREAGNMVLQKFLNESKSNKNNKDFALITSRHEGLNFIASELTDNYKILDKDGKDVHLKIRSGIVISIVNIDRKKLHKKFNHIFVSISDIINKRINSKAKLKYKVHPYLSESYMASVYDLFALQGYNSKKYDITGKYH